MDYKLVSGSPLFKGIEPGKIEDLLSLVPLRIRKYEVGSMIAQSDEQVASLLIVVSGKVKGEMVDYTGRVIKIEDIPAPGALAPAFLFGSRNTFPVNVIAVTDTEIMSIMRSDFLKLLMINDTLLVNFLNIISNRSQFLSSKIRFLTFKTLKEKIAQYLLSVTDTGKDTVFLNLTQSELADYFGVTRPSLARSIGELEDDGLITAKNKTIIVRDRGALENILRSE